jgi:hypothetical protein
MEELATLIEQASAALSAVAAARPDALADDELAGLVVSIEHAGRFMDATRALWAAEVERRSDVSLGDEALCKRAGYRKAGQWLEALTGAAPVDVDRRMRFGALILERPSFDGTLLPAAYPAVADAVRSGRIGVDAGATIARHLQQAARRHAPQEHLDAAERELADEAATLPYWEVELHAKVWREALDPDGAKPREEELHQSRSFKLGRERGGMTPFWGEAPPIEAALMKAAFAESTAPDATPRFIDPDELVDGADPRTREQRQFDVFFGMLQAGMRAPQSMRSTAQVLATVKLEDLQSGQGIAWLDDVAEPISASAAQLIACDVGFQKVVIGENGEPLWLGLKERYFTPAQRRALALRDGGCVANCTAPPSWSHAHHVEFWSHDGPTNIDNGVLLCSGHHRDLHNGLFELRMVNGRPEIRYPFDAEWRPVGRSRILMSALT